MRLPLIGSTATPTGFSSSSRQLPPAPWGTHAVVENSKWQWNLGPLTVCVSRQPYEWHLNWKVKTSFETEFECSKNEKVFAIQSSSSELRLVPRLADRGIVTKLERSLHVLPGGKIDLIIASPLWVQLQLTDPLQTLAEIPTLHLSDTWAGPTAHAEAGELWYFNISPPLLNRDALPIQPHMALTSVRVFNRAPTELILQRLSLPMPRLSLFYSAQSGFWTNQLSLEREVDGELARMELENQPPDFVKQESFISEPRQAPDHNDSLLVFKAFSSLFRNRGDA